MLCPTCNVDLAISDKQGVEIDYCPKCRGIWLDRGELDKIIERSSVSDDKYRESPNRNYSDEHRHRRDDDYDRDDYKKKKKSSFLGDLFDF